MSMTMTVRKVSDEQLRELLDEPDLILDFVDSPVSANQELDLDKAWHGLHFMLTGSNWDGPEPFAYLLDGGEFVGNEEDHDLGYGPARGLTSIAVSRFAAALAGLSELDFKARYDSATMDELEIYPLDWSKEEKLEEIVEWLTTTFKELRQFVHEAAATNQALLIYM
ncbi:YfbM family protein [Hymenobacter volaticus]|uniref:YfbM family protein n=1 Tax=Hymenobacter volaticus TaxID=2932254 RepID=A0ABY4G430_9BACT|nr:YfbM family protein [Hymenobacter volaticus]UOQ65540.1 YfbM family protein [Hymenobacter volaticus]